MGFANAEETDVNVEMTSKPKERQFQVVPVPGVFTRGRWKCWDYRDEPVVEDKILNYSDKTDKLSSSDQEMDEPVIQVKKLYVLLFDPNTTEMRAVPAASDANLTMLDVSPVVQPLSHIHSEPYLSTDASSVATATVVLPGSASVSETGLLPTGKESSTIVVTSVAPASVTPIQVTSRSATVPTSPEPLVSSTIHIPIVSSTLTILSEGEAQRSTSLPISPSLAQSGTTATISLGSVSPQAGPCTTFVSPSTASVASGVSSGSIVSCPASAAVSQPSRQNASSPVLSRQTSLASFSESAVASMPILSPIESVLEDANVMGGATSGPNVVAIDNKIEQAMDLVKTHLTFAVREEVEILRSAIVELEAKVSQLESQNQLLRQFAPAEVLANLGYYIQKKKEAQGSVTSVSASVTFQTLPVSVQPISSSTSQTLVMQPQTVPSNVAAVAPTIATQHAAVSSQTVAVQQTPTSLQQSMSVSAPSLANQHAASLLQSSLSQQVTALPQQQTILQGTVQQQTLSVQKPLGPQPSASASTQVSTVVQQNVATKHLGNVAVATLPIGSEVIMQQPATVVTNAAAQLHYADPNDPKSAVM